MSWDIVPHGFGAVLFAAAWFGIPLFVGVWRNVRLFWPLVVLTILFAPLGLLYAVFAPREKPLPKREKRATKSLGIGLLMFTLLMAFLPSSADAGIAHEYNDGHKSVWESSGITVYWLKLHATWDGATPAQCHSLYPCIKNLDWSRDQGTGGLWRLDHWMSNVDSEGYLADGTAWKKRKISAQFKFCYTWAPVPEACVKDTAWLWVKVLSDGRMFWDSGTG